MVHMNQCNTNRTKDKKLERVLQYNEYILKNLVRTHTVQYSTYRREELCTKHFVQYSTYRREEFCTLYSTVQAEKN